MSLTAQNNRESYLCLVVGGILLVFSNGIFGIVPAATWLAPIFLLRFLRIQHPFLGLAIFVPVHIVAWIIMLYGILPELGIVGNAFGFVYGLILALPYVVDRVLAPRLQGFLSTLVFPLTFVAVEYLLAIWDLTGRMCFISGQKGGSGINTR